MDLWLQFVLMMLLALGELALIGALLGHRQARTARSALLLVATLGLTALWASGLAAAFVGLPISRTLVFWWRRIAAYAFPLAATPLFFATWAVLHRRTPFPKSWLWVPVVGLTAAVLLDSAMVPLVIHDWHFLGRVIDHEGWWRILCTILWAAPTAVTWWVVTLGRPRQVGLRAGNRVRYWTLALTVSLAADGLILSGPPLMPQCGGVLKWLSGALLTLAVLAHRLPDVRRVLRLAAGGTLAVVATALVFATVLWLGGWVERNGNMQLWLLAILAASITALYLPTRSLARRLTGRFGSADRFNTDTALSESEKRIGHGLQVGTLSEQLIKVIGETLTVEHTTVAFLDNDPNGNCSVRPVPSTGSSIPPDLTLAASGPLVDHLFRRGEALSAGDLESDPIFDAVSETEREGLLCWHADLFVPIIANDQALGLLALGPKRSGESYRASEVNLLKSLTAQIGPTLAYARQLDRLTGENERAFQRIRELKRANRELFELDRLKSGLIATITNDLRVPLHTIEETVAQLEIGPGDPSGDLARLSQSLADLRRLVDHLIAFGTMVSKQGSLQLGIVRLPDLVDGANRSLEMMSRARRVTIQASIDEGLETLVGDRERLSDAVYQLMHNAVKYNRAGGQVAVRCATRDGWATLEVVDTGCGIPPEHLEQLGIPGMPLPNREVRPGQGGTGLGLALARYVARVHGGRLEIETQLGSGSTFRLYLPLGGPDQTAGDEINLDRSGGRYR